MKNKVLAVFLSVLMCLSCVNLFPVSAEEVSEFPYATGGLWKQYENEINITPEYTAIQETNASSVLPSSFDITTNDSTAKFFPEIGNQGQIGSCTAWATTYYQFTYEVNKFKNETTTIENTYSPAWTYNYINGGGNNATYVDDAYSVLKNQGAMKWNDFPHNKYLSNYSFAWSSDIEKMAEALKYRATSGIGFVSDSTELDDIKRQLSNGRVFVVWTDSRGWTIEQSTAGEYVIVRGSTDLNDNEENGGHFMTVVGYDDDVKVNVGNGVELEGALKLANSWGSAAENHNNGYIWVAYDALNPTSTHGTSWQSTSRTRTPIFSYVPYTGVNYFHYINVFECDVTFACYVQYISEAPYHVELYAQNGSTISENDNTLKWGNYLEPDLNDNDPNVHSYLVFDYFTLSDDGVYGGDSYNMNNCLSSSWSMLIKDYPTNKADSMLTKVLDNFGNIISSATLAKFTNGVASKTIPVNLAKGRVTAYDNSAITTDDSALVLNFVTRNVALSNVQIYLADYNSDGAVSLADVTAMNSAIAARNGQSYVITDEVEGWGCSLADVIEEEYNIPIEQYVAENYAELSAMNVIPAEMELALY